MSEIVPDELPTKQIETELLIKNLPDDRQVAVGIAFEKPSNKRIGYAIRLRNKGVETKLMVSDEAWEAMVALGKQAEAERGIMFKVASGVWQLVAKQVHP